MVIGSVGGMKTRFGMLAAIVLAPLAVAGAMVVVDRHFGTAGRGRDYVVHIDFPPAGREVGLPPIEGPLDASRPLVVIDAGHGGHDPGAHNGSRNEKDLTLTLARALEARLLAGGGIRVALTRSDDRYLLLEERSGMARRLKADLFVSIHADSADDAGATGATVYTLSDRGSSEEAERLAASENRADSVNGIPLASGDGDVNAILVDLSQRHTDAQSGQFAGLVLREGEGHMVFRDRPLQSAAFVVLKSPDVPSVLFEAGYISNPRDVVWLSSKQGQDAFATVADRAIRVFFARQSVPALLAAP
ncbi:MAG: N-acetylmuramoyl-L-alanine amidase [Sphingomonadales bacterium]|nr:N-acetylmuramoyl-L-alanine amidase [Sphingomonadales bacterium]